MGKGKLHLVFVGVADRYYSVVRPHWASHPLPFFDDVPVGLEDALTDAGQCFAAPVCESCDQLINTFRWIHWISMPELLPRFLEQCPVSSKEVVEGHGLSTSTVLKGALQERRQTELGRRTFGSSSNGL